MAHPFLLPQAIYVIVGNKQGKVAASFMPKEEKQA